MCQQNKGDFFTARTYTVKKTISAEVTDMNEERECDGMDLDDWIFSGEEYQPSER